MNKLYIFAVVAVVLAAVLATQSQDSEGFSVDNEPSSEVLEYSCKMENKRTCPSCLSKKWVTVDNKKCFCEKYRRGPVRNIYRWKDCTNLDSTTTAAPTAAPTTPSTAAPTTPSTAASTAAPTTPSTPSTTPELVVDHEHDRAVAMEKQGRTRPPRGTGRPGRGTGRPGRGSGRPSRGTGRPGWGRRTTTPKQDDGGDGGDGGDA